MLLLQLTPPGHFHKFLQKLEVFPSLLRYITSPACPASGSASSPPMDKPQTPPQGGVPATYLSLLSWLRSMQRSSFHVRTLHPVSEGGGTPELFTVNPPEFGSSDGLLHFGRCKTIQTFFCFKPELWCSLLCRQPWCISVVVGEPKRGRSVCGGAQ